MIVHLLLLFVFGRRLMMKMGMTLPVARRPRQECEIMHVVYRRRVNFNFAFTSEREESELEETDKT